MSVLTGWLSSTGAVALEVAQTAGRVVLLAFRVLVSVFKGNVPLREIGRQFHACGVACLPVTVAASLAVGCIVAVQGMDYVQRYSAPAVFGWAAFLSATREVGPLLLGVILSARLGAFHASQLAALTVTDRVAALQALGVDHIGVLVAPRILVMPVAAALLMCWTDAVSLASATLFAWAAGGVHPAITWASIHNFSLWSDLTLGIQKAAAYGLFSALTSCALGLAAHGGANAVGHAVMKSAVASLVVITALNHGLTIWTAP